MLKFWYSSVALYCQWKKAQWFSIKILTVIFFLLLIPFRLMHGGGTLALSTHFWPKVELSSSQLFYWKALRRVAWLVTQRIVVGFWCQRVQFGDWSKLYHGTDTYICQQWKFRVIFLYVLSYHAGLDWSTQHSNCYHRYVSLYLVNTA